MGNFLHIFNTIKKKDARVLLLGLDNAGKTTLIKQMGLQKMYTKPRKGKSPVPNEDNEDVTEEDVLGTVPTIGFNVKEIQYKNVKFAVWDLGGQAQIRSLWKHYYKGTHGLIYLVDSSTHGRMEESRLALFNILESPEMDGCPVLIVANKCDKTNALSVEEIIERMRLEEKLGNIRPWHVQQCSAITGKGMMEGLTWFVERL